jgi:hypothetical protein
MWACSWAANEASKCNRCSCELVAAAAGRVPYVVLNWCLGIHSIKPIERLELSQVIWKTRTYHLALSCIRKVLLLGVIGHHHGPCKLRIVQQQACPGDVVQLSGSVQSLLLLVCWLLLGHTRLLDKRSVAPLYWAMPSSGSTSWPVGPVYPGRASCGVKCVVAAAGPYRVATTSLGPTLCSCSARRLS